ncbi:PREDICTED: putative colon cancer-associated antigen SK1 [Cercocebus atys]|uniref:putative colon cancer-associated antigen SK1 n=1 Tax=Cercocebus atys TaxID=9531 RepID=UPI0005F4F9AA|nr:PREDICTED: putative colon cancer-associated antigen SK1 [Cercocebus atys]
MEDGGQGEDRNRNATCGRLPRVKIEGSATQVLERRQQVGRAPQPPPQKRPTPGLSPPWGAGSASPRPHVAQAPTVPLPWMETASSGGQVQCSGFQSQSAFSPYSPGDPGWGTRALGG